MKLEEIYSVLEKIAPVALSDEFCKKFDMYDNSGIIINCGSEINGVVFSLDLSEKAVDKAKRLGYNLIVTHHPAVYYGIKKFDLPRDGQARALAECMKCGISVISMHLNFDAAPEGIDYYLMKGLGGENASVAASLSGGGYGRVYEVGKQTLGKFCAHIGKEFCTERIIVYGDMERNISKVASFCGAGCDDYNMAFAKNHGADVFLSSDMKHHEISGLVSSGTAVIVMTHYASESYGLNKIFEKIKGEFKVPAEYFREDELL